MARAEATPTSYNKNISTTNKEPSHTAAPSARKRLQRCTYLETAVKQHTFKLFIKYILIARVGKSKGKANIPQQRCLDNTHRATLTHLHLVQVDGCQGENPWKQHASSNFELLIDNIINCTRMARAEAKPTSCNKNVCTTHTEPLTHSCTQVK